MKNATRLWPVFAALAVASWAAALGFTSPNRPPIIDDAPCKGKPAPTLAGLQKEVTNGQDGGGLGRDNCSRYLWSCGWVGCRRIRGGSQYIWNNNIPACVVNNSPDCYWVVCRIAFYLSGDCSGEPLDVQTVDRRGCLELP